MSRIITLIVALAATTVATAQDPLTPLQAVEMRHVTQVAISPNGEMIAYIVAVPRTAREPDGAAWAHLFVIASNGGKPRALVSGRRNVSNLGWLNNDKITFTMRAGSRTRVFAVSADGSGQPDAISPEATSVRAYSLSPDGSKLAYTTTPPISPSDKKLRAAGFDQIVYEEGLVFASLHVCSVGGARERKLPSTGHVHEITWADDQTVVYSASPTPLIDDRYMERDIYRVDIGGKETKRIVDLTGKLGQLHGSGKGKIAFGAGRDRKDPKDSSLFVSDAEGGEPTSLTPPDFAGHIDEALWIDDSTLLVRATEGCHRTLSIQPAAGGQREILVAGGVAAIEGMSLSADGEHIALVGSTANHGREVFVMGRKGRPRRLTDSNPWLETVALGAQSVIRWRARDGLEIEGLLIKPVGFEEGKKYPLIVHAHGGPESCYVDGWTTRYSTPGQMAAGQGYVSLYPNYRSSTGRGVAFSKAGQGDAAGAEFTDVVDGVDHLIAAGMVDKDRVGITGGSYGGYFSAWAATKFTERFQASVMFVGISNQISKVGTTDIPQESYWSHWHLRPWERIDLFLDRSPIMHSRKARTPILILHGKDDPRVSYTQSVELYRWLKLKGDVPVRLVLYPGEGHGNRKRAHQLDYALRCMRWFDTFLKKKAGAVPPRTVDYGLN